MVVLLTNDDAAAGTGIVGIDSDGKAVAEQHSYPKLLKKEK